MVLCSMSLFFVGSTLLASTGTITMTVSDLCGKTCLPPHKDDKGWNVDANCKVEIWYKQGGYTYINSDGTISLPDNATKIPGVNGLQFGWTPVIDDGEVPVNCHAQIDIP